MAKDLLDFSKFKKIFEDEKNTHLQHPKGHTIIVAHVALSPKLKKQIADLPMHPEKMVELAHDIMEQMPHQKMAEGGKAEKPAVSRINMHYKDVTKRIPELTSAANKILSGEMSSAEYDALVNKHKPVEAYGFVPQPATREEAVKALGKRSEKYGKTGHIDVGHPTELRLDIPSYRDHGVWINSIHPLKPDNTRDEAVYDSVSSVKNAKMIGAPKQAIKVASGVANKSPFAVIRGDWNPIEEKEAVAKAQKYLKHPEWRQVGYDPERHGYFYDRENMHPIESAEEVLQIGPLVLAKKPVYGKKHEQLFAKGGDVEDDFDSDDEDDKYKGPLTSRGQELAPTGLKRGAKWNLTGKVPTLETAKGAIPLRFPSKSDPKYKEILHSPELNEPHEEAMAEWLPRNKALARGELSDKTVAYNNLMSILSGNNPTPQMELSFSRLLDASRAAGIDPRSPEFSKAILPGGKVYKLWEKMDSESEFPEQGREYFEGKARPAFIQGGSSEQTGRKAGDIISTAPSRKIFAERLQHFPAVHAYYTNLAKKHGTSAMGYAEEAAADKAKAKAYLAKVDRLTKQGRPIPEFTGPEAALHGVGLGSKTNLFAHSMSGAGDSTIPDTHILRSDFGLDVRNPGDAATLKHLKYVLLQPQNYHLLKQLNEIYLKEHPAVEYAAEKYGMGKGNPQAGFPGHWLHWNTVAPYEAAQGIGKPHTSKNLTTHGNIWAAHNEPHEYMAEGGQVGFDAIKKENYDEEEPRIRHYYAQGGTVKWNTPPPPRDPEAEFKRNAREFEKGFNAGEDFSKSLGNLKQFVGLADGGRVRLQAGGDPNDPNKPLTLPRYADPNLIPWQSADVAPSPSPSPEYRGGYNNMSPEDQARVQQEARVAQGPRTHYAPPLPGMEAKPSPAVVVDSDEEAEQIRQAMQRRTAQDVSSPEESYYDEASAKQDKLEAQPEQQEAQTTQDRATQEYRKRVGQEYNTLLKMSRPAMVTKESPYYPPSADELFGPNGEPPKNIDPSFYEKAAGRVTSRFNLEKEEKQLKAQQEIERIQRQNRVNALAGAPLIPIPGAPAPAKIPTKTPYTPPTGQVVGGPKTPSMQMPGSAQVKPGAVTPEAQGPEQGLMEAYEKWTGGIQAAADIQGDIEVEQAKKIKKNLEDLDAAKKNFDKEQNKLRTNFNSAYDRLSKLELSPMAEWTERSVPAKISSAIGMILGGIGGGLTRQENPALKFLQYQIDKSVEGMKMRIGRENNILTAVSNQFRNERDAADFVKAYLAEKITQQLKEEALKSGDEMQQALAEKAVGELQATKVQQPLMRLAFANILQNPYTPPAQVNHTINMMRTWFPQEVEAYAARNVQGYGVLDRAPNEPTLAQLDGLGMFAAQGQRLLDMIDKYGYTVPTGKEREEINTIAHDLLNDLKSADALQLTEGNMSFLEKQLGDPEGLWANFVTHQQALRTTMDNLEFRRHKIITNHVGGDEEKASFLVNRKRAMEGLPPIDFHNLVPTKVYEEGGRPSGMPQQGKGAQHSPQMRPTPGATQRPSDALDRGFVREKR